RGAGELEAASQDFLMGGDVVRALHRPDPESAVLPRPRLAVLEDDHRADRLGALEVRDVITLDPGRERGQGQCVGELLEGTQGLALVREPASLLSREHLLGVAGRKRHEVAALTSLWHDEPDRLWRARRLRPPAHPDGLRPSHAPILAAVPRVIASRAAVRMA